ncbi:hypothetical protein SBA3_2760024 [Candidatus Sulfopaludibacter sp. SbA3]|nr:hypothetical protein SBA3_2760024 [Candidatus Sulfopaludibacter sp. SbA3]
MLRLERIWEAGNRTRILMVSGAIILVIALVDWRTEPYVSLGFLYLFPIMRQPASCLVGWSPAWVCAARY